MTEEQERRVVYYMTNGDIWILDDPDHNDGVVCGFLHWTSNERLLPSKRTIVTLNLDLATGWFEVEP